MLIKRIKIPASLLACLILLSGAFAHEGAYHKIESLTQKINKNPDNEQLYVMRAEEYHSVSEWEKALADYQRVAEINPEYERLAYFRGLTFLAAGRYRESLEDFDEYLQQHPQRAEGMVARARALHKLGQHRKAHNDYTQAIALLATPPATLYIERATALADGGQAFLPEAILGLDEAIREFGHLVVLETTAIKLELERKQYEAALKRVDHILRQVTRKEKWLAMRGEILEQSGHRKQARRAYDEALKAIENLPVRIRRTPAMLALTSNLKQRKTSLTGNPAPNTLPITKEKN